MIAKNSDSNFEGPDLGRTLMIVLIHNKETERLQYIRAIIEDILQRSNQPIKYEEIFNQSQIDANFLEYLGQAFRRAILKLKVTSTRNKLTLNQLRNLSQFGLFGKNHSLGKFKATIAAETHLSRKHLEAYKRFLEADREYLLVLESDAIIPNSSLLMSMIYSSLTDGTCCDLLMVGGQFSIEELGISKYINRGFESSKSYILNGFFTNTTVGYLISRRLAHELYASWPRQKLLSPCDWQIEGLLTRSRIEPAKTQIFEPPLIMNGSATGNYGSGVR